MAIEAVSKDDEQQKQQGFGAVNQQQQPLDNNGAVQLGGAQTTQLGQGAQKTQQAPMAAQGQATGQQKSSGMGARLSNLKKYIDANRGSQMSQGIQKGIEQIRTGVQTGIGQAQTKLQQQTEAEKSRIARGEQLIKGSAQGGLGLLERGRTEGYTQDITQNTQQQIPDYSQYGQTATDRLAQFAKYRQGEAEQYDVENQAELERQAKELQKRADLSQSEAGRYQLLRETFGRPAYTQGQQRLDQLILQARPEESKQLQEMTKTIAKPVQEQLGSLKSLKEAENKAILEQASALKGNIAKQFYGDQAVPVMDASGKVTNLGTGALKQFTSELDTARQQEATRIGGEFAQLKAKIEKGEPLTNEDMTKLGRGEDRNLKDFMDYYQKGVNKTLNEKLKEGKGFTDTELAKIGQATGMDLETIKGVQNQQPISIEEYASNLGEGDGNDDVINGKIGRWVENQPGTLREINGKLIDVETGRPAKVYTDTSGGYKHAIFNENNKKTNDYNDYVNSIETNKKNLSDLIKQSIELNPESLGNYRDPQAINYQQYLKSLNSDDLDIGKIASKEDYARQESLNKLANLQFGPLQSSEINEAGTIKDIGVGKYDLEKALGFAREYYNPATTSSMDRVSSPEKGEKLTIGKQLEQGTTDLTTSILGNNQYGQGAGEVAIGASNAFTFGGTETLDSGENALNSLMQGNLADTAGNTALTAGNVAFAAPIGATRALGGVETMLTGGKNITNTYNSVKNVGKKLVGSAGTFWCSQVYKKDLVSKQELKQLRKFLFRILPFKARFLSWYIDNGQRIADLANERNFDWQVGRELLFKQLLPKFKNGDIQGAIDCYDKFTVHICEFVGEQPPYECRKSGIIDSLKFLPKVIKFYWSN